MIAAIDARLSTEKPAPALGVPVTALVPVKNSIY